MTDIDKVAKYWNARPCNVRHSSKVVGSVEYFDEVEAKRYFVEPHNPEFAEFSRWTGKRVLEIGCGIGTDTINFARYGAIVTAIDLSEASVTIARQRAQVFGLQGSIEIIQGSAEDLDSILCDDEKFDLIYSFGVIHHTPNPDKVFAQIAKHLAPGGEFRVMVYNKLSWRVLEILMQEKHPLKHLRNIDRLIAEYSEAQQGCPVTLAYTPAGFFRTLESHDLQVTDVKIRHIFPWKIDKYVKGQYDLKTLWKLVPKPIFNLLQNTIGWHLCYTAKARP